MILYQLFGRLVSSTLVCDSISFLFPYPRDLRALSRGPVHDLRGHVRHVSCLAVLPTGELVSAGRDNTVRIWDLDIAPRACDMDHARAEEVEKEVMMAMKPLPVPMMTSSADDMSSSTSTSTSSLASYSMPSSLLLSSSSNSSATPVEGADYVALCSRACVNVHTMESAVTSMTVMPSGALVTGARECFHRVGTSSYKGSLNVFDSAVASSEEMVKDMMNTSKFMEIQTANK